MLVRPADAPLDDEEWRSFVLDHDFGQLIVPAPDGALPVVVPTHFVVLDEETLALHLAADNPAFPALAACRRVLFSVIGAYTFIPTDWNAGPGADPAYGIPTSYYGAVQLACDAEIVDEPEAKAAILVAQLGHFQPSGGHAVVEPGAQPYGRALGAIRGVRLSVVSVRAKFKFGGNKQPAHRRAIAERLAARDRGLDAEARANLLRRLAAQESRDPDRT